MTPELSLYARPTSRWSAINRGMPERSPHDVVGWRDLQPGLIPTVRVSRPEGNRLMPTPDWVFREFARTFKPSPQGDGAGE